MQNYNLIYQPITITDEGTTEPLTVDEAKSWIRIDAIDESDSTSIFNEDLIIADLITGAREEMELLTGVNLIDRSIKVTVDNFCGYIEIPGPVVDVTKITAVDKYGNDITSQLVFQGTQFPKIVCPTTEYPRMTLTYDVSFDSFPISLKNELRRAVAYKWMNRGDDTAPEFKYNVATKFMRNTWLQ